MIEQSIFEFYKTNPTNTPLSLGELLNLHSYYSDKFMDIWRSITDNLQVWMGENWTEDEKQRALAEDDFELESLPALQSKLRHIIGAFKQVRTTYKVEARSDPNDVIKAKLCELRLRDIEKRSAGKYTDVETFEDGLVLKYGVRKIYLEKRGGLNLIKSKPIDPRNFSWDLSAKEYDITEDARWVAEIERKTKEELKAEYPFVNEELFSTGADMFLQGDDYYYTLDAHGQPLYSIFHHYQKTKVKRYYVTFADPENIFTKDVLVEKYDSKAEAENRLNEIKAMYEKLQLGDETPEYSGEITEVYEDAIDYYCFTLNGIIAYGRLKTKRPPYNVFFAIKNKERFISFLDLLRSPQRIFDRMWAQILFSLKQSVRNTYQANPYLLDKTETPQSIAQKLKTEGGIIWVNDNTQEVIRPIKKAVIDAAWGQVAQAMLSYMEDFGGGRSFFGLNQGEESGRAIYNKVAQGQLIASTFYDNFARFKRAHGNNLIEWLKYYDNPYTVIKTEGGSITEEMAQYLKEKQLFDEVNPSTREGYIYIDNSEEGLGYLMDADLELEVTEEGLSESERERRWYQLVEAEKMDVSGVLISLPSWFELKLESMDIDPDMKARLLEDFKQRQQAIQQQQQQAMDLEKAKLLAGMRNQDLNMIMAQQPQQPTE